MSRAKRPHKAVVTVSVQVYDVLDTGELSGNPVKKEEMEQFGLRNVLFSVEGFDKYDCLKKTKEVIKKAKEEAKT